MSQALREGTCGLDCITHLGIVAIPAGDVGVNGTNGTLDNLLSVTTGWREIRG